MPEGPSIVILKEAVSSFKGKKVVDISGNTKVELKHLKGKKVIDFKSWGKHFLICFKGEAIRIHFMLFGSYRINERKNANPRLTLAFENGELNFYACSVKLIEDDVDEVYETNNSITKEVVIYDNAASPVYPYDFSIVNRQGIKLVASTANPFAESMQYNFEMDTTELFNIIPCVRNICNINHYPLFIGDQYRSG